MPIKLNFDQAIFRWQALHGEKMTYAELAKRAKISTPTIYRLTSGQYTTLDLDKLNRICKVLECTPAELLERVDTSQISSIEVTTLRQQLRATDTQELQRYVPDDGDHKEDDGESST
jgi:DNA-binding Xre family transcriptional regulator